MRKVCLGMIAQPSFPSADLGGSSNFVDESFWLPSSRWFLYVQQLDIANDSERAATTTSFALIFPPPAQSCAGSVSG